MLSNEICYKYSNMSFCHPSLLSCHLLSMLTKWAEVSSAFEIKIILFHISNGACCPCKGVILFRLVLQLVLYLCPDFVMTVFWSTWYGIVWSGDDVRVRCTVHQNTKPTCDGRFTAEISHPMAMKAAFVTLNLDPCKIRSPQNKYFRTTTKYLDLP